MQQWKTWFFFYVLTLKHLHIFFTCWCFIILSHVMGVYLCLGWNMILRSVLYASLLRLKFWLKIFILTEAESTFSAHGRGWVYSFFPEEEVSDLKLLKKGCSLMVFGQWQLFCYWACWFFQICFVLSLKFRNQTVCIQCFRANAGENIECKFWAGAEQYFMRMCWVSTI